MRFSFNHLKTLAQLPKSIKPQDVCNAINSIGFEVEDCRAFTDVKGLKFGKVLAVSPNPNATKLTVCRIKFADQERTIQTTATNVTVGMVIVAFVPGSSVDGNVFAAKELKGIISEGMLSAPAEFGIAPELVRAEHNDGIMAYPEVKDLKTNPVTYLGLDDFIIDVKILSNRADANAYWAMALELAAYFDTQVQLPTRRAPTLRSTVKTETGMAKSLAFVECQSGFTISLHEQLLLAKSGIKAINDIVDLTNLTFLMTGQPVHAYDRRVVDGTFKAEYYSGAVKVFGDKEVKLNKNLVITAGGKVVSVAGTIGIEGRGVTAQTTDFVLEFGRFATKDVRHNMKTIKLTTMAGSQSAKEFTPILTKWAIDYISTIVPKYANSVAEMAIKPQVVAYTPKTIATIAGKENIAQEPRYLAAIKALTTIGYQFQPRKVVVAPHIGGVMTAQDISEEIFRFYGYDTFTPQAPLLTPSVVNDASDLHERTSACGYQEVTTYTLLSTVRNSFNPLGFKRAMKLETFVSKEREEVRNSLIPSLLEVVDYNAKRKMHSISVFDVGMIGQGYRALALASTIKSFAEMVTDLQNILGFEWQLKRMSHRDVHSGVSAQIMLQDKVIGWIGKVHPTMAMPDAYVAEITIPSDKHERIKFGEYAPQPLKQRDITIALHEHDDMALAIEQLQCHTGIFAIELKDQYIKDGKNHITFRVTGTDDASKCLDEKFK